MSKPTLIIAIDPGASGGIAEVWPGRGVRAWAIESEADVRDYIEETNLNAAVDGYDVVCYIEQVGGYIKGNPAPGSAMFRFGDGFGYLRGLIDANRIRREMVRPQTWQAGIAGLAGAVGIERKRALKAHAARVFPNLKVTLSTADALCIADYARKAEAQREVAS